MSYSGGPRPPRVRITQRRRLEARPLRVVETTARPGTAPWRKMKAYAKARGAVLVTVRAGESED